MEGSGVRSTAGSPFKYSMRKALVPFFLVLGLSGWSCGDKPSTSSLASTPTSPSSTAPDPTLPRVTRSLSVADEDLNPLEDVSFHDVERGNESTRAIYICNEGADQTISIKTLPE